RSTLGLEVSVRELFAAPTVAGISDLLDNGDTSATHPVDIVLPLRARGGKPPLFCVHPVTGLAWCYTGLLQHLGPDRPLYGLQTRGLAGDTTVHSTLGELVDDYLAQLRRIQPTGPFHLLGWSLGGGIAHAMACRLQEQGEEVALLAMMDSYPPAPARDFGDSDRPTGNWVAQLIEREGAGQIELEPGLVDELYVSAVRNLALVLDAIPPVFHGDLLFFTATRGRALDAQGARSWAQHVAGEIVNHDIDTEHLDMSRPGPLGEIASVLARALEPPAV
ncbi:alpha/beta fold hydrolase, partial [Nonomuraea thailandensis]